MKRLWMLFLVLATVAACAAAPGKNLDFYFVDVEGGQATLIITPQGESVLVDAGWPGYEGRDADRIVALAKQAGIQQIDYMIVTHYHLDHVGGLPQLAERIPIRTFIDHGENLEDSKGARELYEKYLQVREKGKHLEVKAGDRLPVKGLDIKVVCSAGELIQKPLSGNPKPNPLCASAIEKAADKSENGRSIGFVLQFGKFRFVNLGDLTWNLELGLACPRNLLGEVDLYLTTHHGMDMSGPAQIVHALRPKVAIMNNGAKKGGSPAAWQVVKSTPGLKDFWQLHYSLSGGKDNNSEEQMIANVEECTGQYIKVSARQDGRFTVTNSRNGFSKSY